MIQEKLQKIQLTLKAPKNQYNSFGKYNYRSCEDILEAAKPIVASHGCTLLLTDEVVAVNNRTFLKATAFLFDLADATQALNVSAQAEIPTEKKGMDVSQITGAASSYARKYALSGLFLLDDNKDADYSPAVIRCANCGKPIDAYEGVDGKMISPERHARGSEKKFGEVLCLECINEITDR